VSAPTGRSRWYTLHVRPNYEMSVASRLREDGLEEYVPTICLDGISKRNRFSNGSALFPGYVFSRLDLEAGPRLYRIPGVIRILGYGGHPTPVTDDEIQMIRTVITSKAEVRSVSSFVAGQQVVITGGPLRGVKGTFTKGFKGGQLIVSFPLLNRSLAVKVPSEWVEQSHLNTSIS
jgi:transcriptional antiterminator RfaH